MTDVVEMQRGTAAGSTLVGEVLLLPLREGTSDLFGAWMVPGIAPDVRVLVGVRGGQVIAVAAVDGFYRAEDDPRRVVFRPSHAPLDLPRLVESLSSDVHGLRMWGGPRRLDIAG